VTRRDLWLDPVMERHLGQVSAPDGLWDAIQRPPARTIPRSRAPRHLLVTLAAASLAAALWGFLPRHSDTELRSNTATEIRAWVQSKTGLDIPFPVTTSQAVRLTGVCAVRGGTPSVEVSYRVSGRAASLLVSKANASNAGPSFDAKHRFLKCESLGVKRVSSWVMRGQLYTLAYAATGEARDECLLCHSGAPPLTLSN
jgi:hypothetical protein